MNLKRSRSAGCGREPEHKKSKAEPAHPYSNITCVVCHTPPVEPIAVCPRVTATRFTAEGRTSYSGTYETRRPTFLGGHFACYHCAMQLLQSSTKKPESRGYVEITYGDSKKRLASVKQYWRTWAIGCPICKGQGVVYWQNQPEGLFEMAPVDRIIHELADEYAKLTFPLGVPCPYECWKRLEVGHLRKHLTRDCEKRLFWCFKHSDQFMQGDADIHMWKKCARFAPCDCSCRLKTDLTFPELELHKLAHGYWDNNVFACMAPSHISESSESPENRERAMQLLSVIDDKEPGQVLRNIYRLVQVLAPHVSQQAVDENFVDISDDKFREKLKGLPGTRYKIEGHEAVVDWQTMQTIIPNL